jgi:hypothetical protein
MFQTIFRFTFSAITFYTVLVLAITAVSPASANAGNWLQRYEIQSKYELSQPSAVPKLAKALHDPNPKIRLAAINFLIRLKPASKEVVPELGRVFLEDYNLKVRLHAAYALDVIGGPSDDDAIAPLILALTDPNVHIRKKSLITFQRNTYRGTDLQEALQKMSGSDPHPGLRNIATGILVRTTNWEPKKDDGQRKSDHDYSTADFDLHETKEENRHAVAVIIGNQHYSDANRGVPDVDYAQNDAELMFNYVTKTLGYREGNIIYMKDATQADFIGTFGTSDNPKGKLYDWIKPGESDVFIYYSGHGAPGPTHGRGYLLPVNADPMKIELNGYSLETLYKNIGKLPAKTVMIIIDACFSGGSASGSIVKSASSISMRVVETRPTIPQAIVLTAASPQEIASWDDNAKHGLFTRHFVEGMVGKADGENFGNGDGTITLFELKKYINEEVSYRARRLFGRDQHPQITGDENSVLAVLPANSN